MAAEKLVDCLRHFSVRLKAAHIYSRTYCGANAPRQSAERNHLINGNTENIGNRAAPAAMHSRGDTRFGVAKQHRHAVCREADERESLYVCNDAVRLIFERAKQRAPVLLRNNAHLISMHLLCKAKLLLGKPQRFKHAAIVFAHVLLLVSAVLAKVKALQTALAHAAETRGEAVGIGYGRSFHIHKLLIAHFSKGFRKFHDYSQSV